MKIIKLITSLSVALLLLSCNKDNKDYDAIGSFEATEIIVSSQANGSILDLNAEEGQQLQAGQIIGYIDSTQLHLQKMSLLSSARGVRVQAPNISTQTAAIEEQISKLERERKRVQSLLEADAANQKQLDDINSQLDVLNSQLEATKSSLQKSSASVSAQSSSMEIQVAQLDDQIEKTKITSPVDGTVLNRYAQKGELATMGKPLFKVADIGTMYLRAYVTNDQLAKIKLNDRVTVRVDDGDGKMKSFEGTINWISEKSEFTPKTIQTKNERANLVYAIKVAVPNDGYIKIGMYGEVVFDEQPS